MENIWNSACAASHCEMNQIPALLTKAFIELLLAFILDTE